jgi:hypothetical protein
VINILLYAGLEPAAEPDLLRWVTVGTTKFDNSHFAVVGNFLHPPQIHVIVADLEGPIHKEVAAARLARTWELERVGERMLASVQSAWRSLSREKLLRIHGEFLWPAGASFQVIVRRPSHDDQSRRSIHEIPSEEIAAAMKNITRDSLSIERDKLLVYVARIFGFERAGNHIQKALEGAFEELLETGDIVLLEDRVSLPN